MTQPGIELWSPRSLANTKRYVSRPVMFIIGDYNYKTNFSKKLTKQGLRYHKTNQPNPFIKTRKKKKEKKGRENKHCNAKHFFFYLVPFHNDVKMKMLMIENLHHQNFLSNSLLLVTLLILVILITRFIIMKFSFLYLGISVIWFFFFFCFILENENFMSVRERVSV